MARGRILWTAFVSATLALLGARAASAQTSNAPPAQTLDWPSAERNGLIVRIDAGDATTDQFLSYYSANALTQAAGMRGPGPSGWQPTEAGRGRSTRHKILGGVVGGIGGFFGGWFLGAAIEGDRCECDDPGFMGALIGGPVGAAAGGILGYKFLF